MKGKGGCSGVLNIGGVQYRCEQQKHHGSGCSNRAAGAVWASGSNIDAWGTIVRALTEEQLP